MESDPHCSFEAATVTPGLLLTLMPMEPLVLELLLVWLDSCLAASRLMALSAVKLTLLPALMSLPWIKTLESLPAPVAVMLTLLPAFTVLPRAVLLTIEFVAARACIRWAKGGFDDSSLSALGVEGDLLHFDDLLRVLVVLDELFLALLAVSATPIMLPCDALKMRRWWDLFIDEQETYYLIYSFLRPYLLG